MIGYQVSWLLMFNALAAAGDFGLLDRELLSVVMLCGSPLALLGLARAADTGFPGLRPALKSERFRKWLKRFGAVVAVVLCGSVIWTQLNWPDLSSETNAPYRPVVALCLWLLGALGFLPLWKQSRATPGLFVLVVMVWLVGVILMAQKVSSGE